MALINEIIGPQNYEIIRDQIALILGAEIGNQFLLSGNYDIDAIVYIERQVPINGSELDISPVINVMLATIDFDNQDLTQTRGTCNYLIDVYCKAKTDSITPGDTKAMFRLQRMLGICRAILEASQYKTLGFVPPFVMGRKIKSLQIAQPGEASADNLVRGRLVLEVQIPESQEMITARLIDGSDTSVRIGTTDEGYVYVTDNY